MQMIRCTRCMKEMDEGVRICPYCGFDQQGEDRQPSNALVRGTILHGRYLVGNVIGQGGFGITYVGYDLTLEMKVAVKEYFPSGSATRSGSISDNIQWDFAKNDEKQWTEGLNRFLKEARRMARLDSVPSIVRVRDAFRENQTAYIVMDFVEGETLKRHILTHGALRWDECLRLLEPILDSLAVIHDNGFIHRDISPDNIMLQPDGTARLLDMGAAVDVRDSGGRVSMVVVKRNFSAPEQYLESETLGSWTDVYSMAATIYYCLTGKVVPEAMEREFKKMSLNFAPELCIPQDVTAAIAAGLELKAENRIRDMREFKRRLTESGPASKEIHTGSVYAGPEPVPDPGNSKQGNEGRTEDMTENPAEKPMKRSRFMLLSALIIVGCSCITTLLFHTSGIALWGRAAAGCLTGGVLLSRDKKRGQYKRGEQSFSACLAFGILFGVMAVIPFCLLICLIPQWKEKIQAKQAVSLRFKLGTIASGFWMAVMALFVVVRIMSGDSNSGVPAASSGAADTKMGESTTAALMETETWKDTEGNTYTCTRRDGLPEGTGSCVYADGSRYEGEFKSGKKDGTGVFYWTDGDRYEGEYKDDTQNGTGIYYFTDGRRYEGEWKNGKRDGIGTFYWTDDRRYEGEWKNGIKNGTGTFYWSEGRYEGEFTNDVRNGRGIVYYSEGEYAGGRRECTYEYDKINGEATFYRSDGTILSEQWENGEKISEVQKEN